MRLETGKEQDQTGFRKELKSGRMRVERGGLTPQNVGGWKRSSQISKRFLKWNQSRHNGQAVLRDQEGSSVTMSSHLGA